MLVLLAQTTTDALPAAPGLTWLLVRGVLVLLVVCIGAWALLRYVLPRLGKVGGRGVGGRHFTILGRWGLDHKSTLWIVRVGRRLFLLSSGDQGVRCVSELHDKDLEEQ